MNISSVGKLVKEGCIVKEHGNSTNHSPFYIEKSFVEISNGGKHFKVPQQLVEY